MPRVCIFGDSMTRGAYDPGVWGWTTHLRNWIENSYNRQHETPLTLYNLGVSGDNTDLLLKRLDNECRARLYLKHNEHEHNIIIFFIGTNDCLWPAGEKNVGVPIERFSGNIVEIIKIARRYVFNILFLSIIPFDESKPIAWDKDKWWKNEHAEQYNSEIERACKKNSVHYLDINTKFKAIQYQDFLFDGGHLNSAGERFVFEAVSKFLVDNKII